MNNVFESVVSLFALIVGVAVVAVLVSRKSNTAGVIGAAGSAFSSALGVAVSPVTGGGNAPSFQAPVLGGGFGGY